MTVVDDRVTISEADGYGVVSVPLSAVSWQQWCALGELYAKAAVAGQCVPNGSPEAHQYLTAGGWNLVAPLPAFGALAGAVQRIVR